MGLTIIAAVADNLVIGVRGRLPWHLPADLKRFKQLTMGHVVIVGRRTFEGIGGGLPGRRLVVLTRGRDVDGPAVSSARSLSEAIRLAAGSPETFVAGGSEVYRQALPMADRLLLTWVHAEVDGDARFPPLDERSWRLVSSKPRSADESNPIAHTFAEYVRSDSFEPE